MRELIPHAVLSNFDDIEGYAHQLSHETRIYTRNIPILPPNVNQTFTNCTTVMGENALHRLLRIVTESLMGLSRSEEPDRSLKHWFDDITRDSS